MTSVPKPFNLMRWFAVAGFFAIASVALVIGLLLSRFVLNEMVQTQVEMSAELVKNVARTQFLDPALGPAVSIGDILDQRRFPEVLAGREEAAWGARQQFLDFVRRFPDALLVHVYAMDRTIIWSSNPEMIGFHMSGNDELERAFATNDRVTRIYSRLHGGRQEQSFLAPPRGLYVESYIPLRGWEGEADAVVEIYWEPRPLLAALQRAYTLLWVVVVLGALATYLSLSWIVRRAASLLAAQERELVESRTWSAIGEMSYAMAHSLRNPLATIRSSAELALDATPPDAHRDLTSIIRQVDRLSAWLRELLLFAHPTDGELVEVDLVDLLNEAIDGFTEQIEAARIGVEWTGDPPRQARVLGDALLLKQALNSVLSNALEAMGSAGGRLLLSLQRDPRRRRVVLAIGDTGPGMSSENLKKAQQPFSSSKKGGLGVGLALVRRIMRGAGGEFEIESRPGAGTRVRLTFQAANGV